MMAKSKSELGSTFQSQNGEVTDTVDARRGNLLGFDSFCVSGRVAEIENLSC